LPNKPIYYSGQHRATEVEAEQGRLDKSFVERGMDSMFQIQLDEAAAQDRAGWSEVVCGLRSTESDKA